MPRKSEETHQEVTIAPVQQPLLPKISYTQILVVLLVIAAFVLGNYQARLAELQTGTTALAAANPQAVISGAITPTPGKVDVGVGNYQAKGDPNAKMKIVEFEDDRCPFCQQYMTQTENQIIKDYVDTGKAVLYFRDYPFLGPASTLAANANGCANEQGKFWDWIDYMYKNQPAETDTSMYTNDNLTNIAGQLGMDTTQFGSCMTSNKYANQAAQDLAEGQKAGVSGTPTIFIDGTPVVGAEPYSTFKALLDQELAKLN